MASRSIDERVARKLANELGVTYIGKIRSGDEATAYEVSGNMVLKVTCSYDDAKHFAKLKGVEHEYLPEVYDVIKFEYTRKGYGKHRFIGYGILVEKLKRNITMSQLIAHYLYQLIGTPSTYDLAKYYKTNLKNQNLWGRFTDINANNIPQGVYDIIKTSKALSEHGMNIWDIHRNNIGVNKHGNWTILDFGRGDCNFTPDFKEFEL